jgi:hypothetical protein
VESHSHAILVSFFSFPTSYYIVEYYNFTFVVVALRANMRERVDGVRKPVRATIDRWRHISPSAPNRSHPGNDDISSF